MTIEEFAHRCLMIKAGNANLDIPCCATCENYKSLTFGNGETIWECHHPATEDIGDEYVSIALCMAPEDFCSSWRSRKENSNGRDSKNE